MALYTDGDTSKTIQIYFVQDGASCSVEMKNAFLVCEKSKFHPKIISEDCIRDINEFKPNIVYVLEHFSGEVFEFLSDKNCLVVGPSCINSCVSNKIPIPDNGSPVFNITLRGCVISTTKLHSKERDEIKKLSSFMGAVYSDDLTLAVTHLIAENITSLTTGKCGKAVGNNIPIISPEWIKKTWELSSMGTKAPDAMNYKLAPFKGMHISCSNLSTSVKKKLQQIIEANGGIYQGTLELKKTVVLVIGEAEGKKWQFAQQWEIPCVAPSWIYASVERGSLAPSKDHLVVARPKCSTPTPSADSDSFMSSEISVVPFSNDRSNVDETNTSFGSEFSVRSVQAEIKSKETNAIVNNEYKKLLQEFSINEIRTAGLFLDGCKIYLSGFAPLEVEKLKKVINAGGATMFPSISDCLSHIVVGEFSPSDMRDFTSLNPRPNVVKLEWLLECLRARSPVPVGPFLCLQPLAAPPASPLSHKGLKLLKSQNGLDLNEAPNTPNDSRNQVSRKLFVKAPVVKSTPGRFDTEDTSVDMSALEKRALEEMNKEKKEQDMTKEREEQQERIERDEQQRKAAEKANTSALSSEKASRLSGQTDKPTINDGDQSITEPFFQGIWFEILIYEETQQIQESIELVGGQLVTKPSDPTPDYAIVPVEGCNIETSAKNVVSLIFLEDCYDHGCLITDLEYYHRPIPGLVGARLKLEGTVLALSGFGRAERRVLEYVATTLGAIVQVMFARSEYPEKGVKKSTHLVCKEMSGKKYDAAIKWGVPVVPASWLLEMIEPGEPSSVSSSQILSQTLQGPDMVVEMTEEPPGGTQRIETQPGVSPSCGPSHRLSDAELVEFRAPRAIICETRPGKSKLESDRQTPDTILKRWKSNQEGMDPGDSAKSKRTSTPTHVIMKQLWTKFGSVPFDGIDPETGNLLPDGPYGQWARNSGEKSFDELNETQDRGGSNDGTPHRKRWRDFVNSYEKDLTEIEPPKPKRPSTPLDVLKKQLWVKFGGAKFEGIDPDTGELLKEGPYAEWARNSMSENSFVEPAEKSSGEAGSGMGITAQSRLSDGKSGDNDDLMQTYLSKNVEDISPAVRQRLSSRSNASIETKDSPTTIEKGQISRGEENKPGMSDFNPLHSSTVCEGTSRKGLIESTRTFLDSPKIAGTSRKGLIESTRTFLDSPQITSVTPKENIPANHASSSSPLTSTSRQNKNSIEQSEEVPYKIFLLSGLSVVAKQKYEGIIHHLGAGLTQVATYDPSTTHIIIEKPIRSEKLLCCIASGKWVLHSSYLDYCYETRGFLPEEDFEWGNPAASERLPTLQPGSTEAGLANAAYKWRLRKRDMGAAAPFREMRVVLFTTESKEPQFRRLLDAGGATILPKSEVLNGNYVIWEHERVELPVPLTELAARGTHIVPPVYLGEYLVKAPPPAHHYPPPYLKVFKKRKLLKS